MKKQSLWTKDFLSISFTSFFIFIGFYILLTTLPIYVLDNLHGNETQVGLILSVYLIAAVLCRPFTGKWLDELGRKKILLFAVFIFAISSILYFWTDSLPLLLALRFVHGIGFGMATTATGAIVADLIPNERKGEGLGYYAMFMNLAMVIGPFTGLTIIQYASFYWIFGLCSILGIFALALSLIVRIPVNSSNAGKKAVAKITLSALFEKKAIPVSIVAGVLAMGYSGILSFISVYAKHLGLLSAASFFFVVYAASILISRPFTGKWFDLYGENRIIYPSIILFALGLLLLSQANNTFLFLLSGALIGLGYGTLSPGLQTIAIQKSDPSKRGLATSTFFTFLDSGIGVGSYVLGVIVVYTGFSTLYLILSVLIVVAFFIYYLLHGKHSTGRQPKASKADLPA
ncbi:MFS transporter [Bacillus sp. S/N-304-OC-R1]|uniref:MFS transporter n=1 Tax=Bacillus sp. S/N-304-OC-R1 TaxID=2758034 RepID=UPI001C8E4893|nr:MFS transporter [Bacillus sp. S/N-304-OC-R1]MBY0122953.1 MFS transporter [Bacillus sp. S/N-304-OC-R1]